MFERLHRLLLGSCGAFALVGLTVAVAGAPVFAFWRDAVADALWGTSFPAELRSYAAFTDGVLGGSIVGKWVACAWLVHVPIRQRARWGLVALLAAHLVWFAIDATASVLYGAPVNVWMIDLLPLVVVGGLALALWPHTKPVGPSPKPRPSVRVLLAVCLASIGTGLAAAFAIRSPLFALYDQATADTFFAGVTEGRWVAWQRFAYGLIGATLAGHFVALAAMLWRAPTERWVLHAVATSMTAWFVVDTGACLVHGAWFNILQINLPSYVGTMLVWAVAMRREGAARAGVSSG
ncbi:MAG: hypothetical protein KC619_33970 [Myxococcales bacterium]|nr:hypothetical protein [Myxococcales bacterium]